ncbi:hypothetical protein ACGGAI_23830 [Streptomyces antibioticus]|uniref:hypothetical protein n=1 Tax=Streptomyces antibioticus TaxID=1890 RepID=UPI00372037E5
MSTDAKAVARAVNALTAQVRRIADHFTNSIGPDDAQRAQEREYAADIVRALGAKRRHAAEHGQAADTPRCTMCGSTAVTYLNYRDQPFCGPCANGEQQVPAADEDEQRAARRAALREKLDLTIVPELARLAAETDELIARVEQAEAGRLAADNMLRAVCDVFGGPHQDPIVKARETLARAEQAEAAIERVREAAATLTTEADAYAATHNPECECEWVSATLDAAARILTALDGAAATELEKTARVFAALHRSAEDTVTRVIDLQGQWVKAGPPPLGAPLARWWDQRLAELHQAILPPADAPGSPS